LDAHVITHAHAHTWASVQMNTNTHCTNTCSSRPIHTSSMWYYMYLRSYTRYSQGWHRLFYGRPFIITGYHFTCCSNRLMSGVDPL